MIINIHYWLYIWMIRFKTMIIFGNYTVINFLERYNFLINSLCYVIWLDLYYAIWNNMNSKTQNIKFIKFYKFFFNYNLIIRYLILIKWQLFSIVNIQKFSIGYLSIIKMIIMQWMNK